MDDATREAIEAFKEQIADLYGDRLDRVLLFGSHAREEATDRSDIDLLLILKGEVDPYTEIERVSEVTYEIELEHGVLFGIVPTSAEDYEAGATALLRNVRRDGVPA